MHFLFGKRTVMVLLAVAAVMLLPLAAQATVYGFSQITNNGSTATATQYSVNVTDYADTAATNDVLFLFTNVGSVPSSICDIYFDDGHLLALAQTNVNNSGTVAFNAPATPAELPGANLTTPVFVTTDMFSADSDKPLSINGVGLNEATGIVFTLKGTATINDVIADLNSGALRIGLHVQAINPTLFNPDGTSESFVNDPKPLQDPPVPVPASALLLGSGLVALGLIGWGRREKKA